MNFQVSVNSDENVILRDTRLVIPKSLQRQIVNIAHEGHQGVVKCKQLLREKVWFPGIDALVTKIVNQCISCQCNTPNYHQLLGVEVSIDFKQLSHTQYLLVVTDDYSRYPVVEFVNSTSSHHVIPVLDKIFSMFGVHEIVKSDNGPPFQGGEFHKYAQYLGFTHRKITPYHPRANGECERFMRTLGKVVKIAATESQTLNQILCRFLRSYQATPHSTTGIAPATALFSRPIRVRLPEMKHLRVQNDDKIRNKDTVKKEKIRKYADDKRYVKKFPVQIGDEVLLKQEC